MQETRRQIFVKGKRLKYGKRGKQHEKRIIMCYVCTLTHHEEYNCRELQIGTNPNKNYPKRIQKVILKLSKIQEYRKKIIPCIKEGNTGQKQHFNMGTQ